ncbi:MAG: Gfo/Idh/MocA family oxidoreductase [Chitinophagaceae bacterium]|nr:Gfo/Idh/MocA family oxidoreductase [Chitinophagaceae bacterium]
MQRNTNRLALSLLCLIISVIAQSQEATALRVAVAGTSHGHVSWILGRKEKQRIELVGIYETDTALIRKQTAQFKLSPGLFYNNLEQMLDKVKPQAVVAFGSIHDHLAVVEACAPRGIHVMVEKPLAVSGAHAQKMKALADKHKIHLLTNYETSWYPTTERTYRLVNDSNYLGKMRKVVFHHGHEGPKEIGVSKEFFNWLTDPIKNGGGAVIDFGCYGANIITYLMRGEQPLSVTARLQQLKPSIYPKVDDEATIIVEYKNTQCIIQASWNWPYSRKDMEVYGETGYIFAIDRTTLKRKSKRASNEVTEKFELTDPLVYDDPFLYFADVINKKIEVAPYSVYSLSNNVMVLKILDAARESAKTGKTVVFK